MSEKACSKCGVVKPLTSYYKHNKTKDGKYPHCKQCQSAMVKDWEMRHPGNANERSRRHRASKSPEWKRDSYLRCTYGISLVDYEQMLIDQDGHCKWCPRITGDGGKALSVDHDHSCCPGPKSCGKCVRWLLCDSCNKGVGSFKDNIEVMARAIEDLREFNAQKSSTMA